MHPGPDERRGCRPVRRPRDAGNVATTIRRPRPTTATARGTSAMTPPFPPRIQQLIDHLARGDRSTALALHALITVAGQDGCAPLNEIAIHYRDDHLSSLRAEGKDAEREAGRLSLDEVRQHLATSVLLRLASEGAVVLPHSGLTAPDAKVKLVDAVWAEIAPHRGAVADVLKHTGEHPTGEPHPPAPKAPVSVLEA